MKIADLPDAQQTADLVRDLARLYVGRPSDVQVGHQVGTDGSAFFALRSHPDDEARLIGSRGSHVNALTFLIDRIGAAQGRIFTFRLVTDPNRRSPSLVAKDAISYDPAPAKALLERLLIALGAGTFCIEISPGRGPRRCLRFDFTIYLADDGASARFREDYGDGEDGVQGLSISASIDTLFRAIAKHAGVQFQISFQ